MPKATDPRIGPLVASLLIAATPVASWWAIGDRSADFSDPVYFIRPPAVDPALERAAGIAALLIMVAAAAILLAGVRRGRFDGRWSGVVVPLCAAGVLIALVGRALTAGIIPDGFADLGAFLVIALYGPVIAGLLILASASFVVRRRARCG